MTELEKTIKNILSPALETLAMAASGAAPEGCIWIGVKELDALRNRVTELEAAQTNQTEVIKKLSSERDTFLTQRNAASANHTAAAARCHALEKEIDELKQKCSAYNSALIRAESDARSAKGMRTNPDPRYNKLCKDYSAACNQRDSYAQTITKQRETIDDLRRKLETAQTGVTVPVKVLVVDSVAWTADEVRKVRDISVQRAQEIEDLKKKLDEKCGTMVKVGNFHYGSGDIKSLLNTIDQLTRNNNELRKSHPTVEINGKYMTIYAIECAMDTLNKLQARCNKQEAQLRRAESTLRGTVTSVKREREKRRAMQAELDSLRACKQYVDAKDSVISAESRAESYKDQMNQWRDKATKAEADVAYWRGEAVKFKDLADAAQRVAAANAATATVKDCVNRTEVGPTKSVIEVGPQVVELRILQPEGTTIVVNDVRIDANDLPRMADDLVKKTKELQDYQALAHSLNVTAEEQKRERDTKLAAQDITIRSLQDELNELRASQRAWEIERKILKGRLAEANAADKTQNCPADCPGGPMAPKNVVNGVELKDGVTYMTTSLGLLPVDTVGMRKVVDQMEYYRGKITALAGFLDDWSKN